MLWALYRRNEVKKEVLRIKRFELTFNEFGLDDLILATHFGDDYVTISPQKKIVYPGVYDALPSLFNLYPLHMITNGFEEVQHKKIATLGIRKYFESITTSDEAGVKKPEPGIFEMALAKANAKPEESLMIGDDLAVDIEGAANMGMDQIYFNPEKTEHEGVPTFEAQSWKEIENILIEKN
jgi:putative hydrolase of the HAD superfamily